MLPRDAGRVLKKHNIGRPDGLMAAGTFFGATRLQLRSGDFTVSAVTHTNSRTVPMHAHANAFFSMLISGHYREWFGQEHWDARPLSMVLRPAQAEHRDEIGPDGSVFLCVDIAPAYCDALADSGVRLQRRAFDDRPMSRVALRLLKELCEKQPGWQSVAESLVNELVAEYADESRRVGRRDPPSWLQRAIDMLHADPAHQSLRAIAADLDLHPVHLSRAFKHYKGMSVSQYLRELRLQRTARRLLESRESLAAIAHDNGFADQSHMTRDFIRATHWSPAKLRCQCERLR
ncbi:helix-turn-helix transcriptional regulator [Peristeroidobacter agariperforans]|uniref:helix-turn-helix transcriptional regulator n=1 Tax=Peristeroidobacter agariperforans TaxID=268404 RepID=UPI00101BA4B9|nr:AraC family transcriptional regulator [Peristeroidobacter agariperforans]